MEFAEELSIVRWESMYQLPSCDEQFGFYQGNMERLIDQCFPFKTVTRHSSDKPWVTDSFRQLIKKRQRARMSGNTTLAKQLRNKVIREAKRLRYQFYQSKIAALDESSSKDWWKQMKVLMGLHKGGDSEMVSLANRHTDGDIQALVNMVNDFLVSVSSDMPRLTGNHPVFQLQEPLPAAFIISVGGTMAALRKVKVNKATGPDDIPTSQNPSDYHER